MILPKRPQLTLRQCYQSKNRKAEAQPKPMTAKKTSMKASMDRKEKGSSTSTLMESKGLISTLGNSSTTIPTTAVTVVSMKINRETLVDKTIIITIGSLVATTSSKDTTNIMMTSDTTK